MAARPRKRIYFHDSEFVDGSGPFAVDFISIGIVPLKAGAEYYGVSSEFNEAAAVAQRPWLKDNVIAKLPPASERKTVKAVAADILACLKPAKEMELWAKNGAYDHYIFSQIFGGLNNMCAALKDMGVDRVTFRDIDELRRAAGYPKLPEEPAETAHIAIEDAKWDRHLYKMLVKKIGGHNPTLLKGLDIG
jgi:hypothetical protein